KIYGLYKFITVSPRPKPGTRPGIFDWTGAAKWDAWDATGKTFEPQGASAAQARYVEIARSLGWPGLAPTQSETKEPQANRTDDDAGSGMGIRVSALERPEEAPPDNTIHGLAVDGNVEKLRALLSSGESVDVNSYDEFGYTPLHLACDRGHTAVVELLLASGARADITTNDEDKLTARELAEVSGKDDIIRLLSTASST
ncbi:ankyrin, partial [Clavulina sp. PMI_390]